MLICLSAVARCACADSEERGDAVLQELWYKFNCQSNEITRNMRAALVPGFSKTLVITRNALKNASVITSVLDPSQLGRRAAPTVPSGPQHCGCRTCRLERAHDGNHDGRVEA